MRRAKSKFRTTQISFEKPSMLAFVLAILAASLVTTVPAYSQSDVFRVEYDAIAETFVVHHTLKIVPANYNPGPLTGEIAVEQHSLFHGETFPLPWYNNGVPAEEDEIFWTVSLDLLHVPTSSSVVHDIYCSFDGRTVDLDVPMGVGVAVLVTVVAIQKGEPVATESSSFGEIKAMFK